MELGRRVGVDCFDSDLSKKPWTIVRDGLALGEKEGRDIVIIDTAGRFHLDQELMEELGEFARVLEGKSAETILVVDAMAGQEAVSVAMDFHQRAKLTGVILSKMDSDARGGAALSIGQMTGVPVRYLSTGEGMGDLEIFHPDRLAKRILDMGDVVSLVEKAQKEIDEKEQEEMLKNLEKGQFTINDYIKQMGMDQKTW